jgi:hydroxyethylthiazole kinase-like uncharacterized protein yjeF
MKIVTAAEMREIDRITSERFGVSSLTLMENAGAAVAEFVSARHPKVKSIGIICGKGNNGGDGLVAARKLKERGKDVRVLLLADKAEVQGDARTVLDRLAADVVVARNSEDFHTTNAGKVFEADVLIDAILGSGFRPPVTGLYAEAIGRLNAARSSVIAVDVPSGADADVMGEQSGAVARADAVVTFTAPRKAHVFGNLTNGPLLVAPIGSPAEAIGSSLNLNLITAQEVAPLIGPRVADANKGNYGHVLVLGGSVGKAGAAAMCGVAALRAGAGLCTVATAKSALPTVAGFHPELMTEPLAETKEGSISYRSLERITALAKAKTVLALGPGISRFPETSKLVRAIAGKATAAMVLDADGLNAFDGLANLLNGQGRDLVITPHPGEMARLMGCAIPEVQRDRIHAARTFACGHQVIVVLKGHRTLIGSSDGAVWVNATGNPGMATGGTGDILTGMTAGLIAQNPTKILDAVLSSVHLHGLAGDVARERNGEHSLIATDLLDALPEAFRRVTMTGLQETVVIQH